MATSSLRARGSREYIALKKYEAELLHWLHNANLVDLASQATECGLLLSKVVTNLKKVDHSVLRSLKCRYLLYSIYIHNYGMHMPAVSYEYWVDLLSQFIKGGSVLSDLKQYYKSLVRGPIGKISYEGGSVTLTENDILKLTEVLAGCSSKWAEIATQLWLPHNEIANIRAMMHMLSPFMRLKETLILWISGKFSNAKRPTLENLEEALRSEVVGLGVEALELRSKLVSLESQESVDAKNCCAQQSCTKEIKITSQTPSAEIREGGTVLFEVQVRANIESNQKCKQVWYKNDKLLHQCDIEDSLYYSYGCSHVLIICLFVCDIKAEGVYRCTCEFGGVEMSLVSKPIALKVLTPVDEHIHVLTDFYTAQPEVPKDTWPPESSKTYISLALIKQESFQDAEEYGRSTIQGDADDIYKAKESIMYEIAFSNLRSGAHLLVEGRPGSGKTTLVHKVSQDWARGKIKFEHLQILFLVHLRGFCSNPNIELHDILKCYYSSNSTINTIVTYAEKHSGLGLCFILDGLDEYLADSNSYIVRLIKRMVLPRAIIIIASRPAAAAKFRSEDIRQIEVIGFFKEHIHDYIEHYPFPMKSNCEELHKYLDLHPNVHQMCYLPIHAAMVCYLYDKLKVDLPQTETEIYKEFTKQTILRGLYRDENETEICVESIEDLSSNQKHRYKKVCKLAYEMTLLSKQVMRQTEVKSFFKPGKGKDSFGLITIDQMAKICGFQEIYTFLHLTFQEFLAAYYISTLKEKEQAQLIEKYGKARQMQQVWKFYCGLVKFSSECKNFKALISDTDYKTLFKIHCSFESQQSCTCDNVVEEKSLSLTDDFLNPTDFTAIAYVVSHAQKNPVEELIFKGCAFGEEGVASFVKKAGGNISKITTLSYHGQSCSNQQLRSIKYLMHSLSSLEILDISDVWLGSEEVNALTDSLNHSSLQVLKVGSKGNPIYSSFEWQKQLAHTFLSRCNNFVNVCFSGSDNESMCLARKAWPLPRYFYCNFPDQNLSFCELRLTEVKAFSYDLKINPRYTKLTLACCGIDDIAMSYLAQGLKNCRQLEILELSCNRIGNIGVMEISKSTRYCSKLHIIDLSSNRIGDEGAGVLVNALNPIVFVQVYFWNNSITKYNEIYHLHNSVKFHTLEASNRGITDASLSSLTSVVLSSKPDSCRDLLHLHLQLNSISDGGLQHLGSALKRCSNLLVLNLSYNCLGKGGSTALGDALKHCTKLLALDISHNFVSSAGAEAITAGLKFCPNLLELKMNSNNIGSVGAKALAETLEFCVILQMLEVNSNNIGREGATALAIALKTCANLYALDIGSNRIGIEGAKALAVTLKHTKILQKLDISNNNLSCNEIGIILNALPHCIKMSELNTSYNELGSSGTVSLRNTLEQFESSICKLKISNSDIGAANFKCISDALRDCNGLQELEIGCIGIGTTAAETISGILIQLVHISKLDISDNSIHSDCAEAIFSSLKCCINLCELDISNNSIGNAGVIALANAMKHYLHLSRLDISSNNILQRGFKVLSEAFTNQHGTNLRILNVSFNELGCSGALSLADGLIYCKNLCELGISNTEMDDAGAVAISDFLMQCKNLHKLDISNNNICKEKSVTSLANALKHCSLFELNISANKFGSSGAAVLAKTLKHFANLKKLNVTSCNIGSDGAFALAVALDCCTKLKEIDVSYNNIADVGMSALAEGLKQCKFLQELNVSDNVFQRVGTIALAQALKHCKFLHKLYIHNSYFGSHGHIGNAGAIILAEALEKCTNLYSLDIRCNSIGNEGAKALAGALEHCKNIHILDVSYNCIGDVGAIVLADALKHCTNLCTLLINANEIRTIGAEALAEDLRNCIDLDRLDISSNALGRDVVETILDVFQHCTELRT